MVIDEIKELLPTLSPKRLPLAEKLLSLSWFFSSAPEVQREVLTLPEDFQGYLEDLAGRPDEIGELDIICLNKVLKGKFLVTSIFEVRSTLTNQEFTYEYISWKYGARPGAKGIIFLESNGEITHFLVAKEFTFSTASENYEAIGGLYVHLFENKPFNLPKKIENEIRFHLGIDKIEFKRVFDLGKSSPDWACPTTPATSTPPP